MAGDEDDDQERWSEADAYDVLEDHDVNDEPSPLQPVGPGDVFADVELGHLADPFVGHVIVVGHPCSLRRGIALQPDLPVAPIAPPGIPTSQHGIAERVLPVRKLLPPGTDQNHVVQLTRTTTVPSEALDVGRRVATLSAAGIVALQQRVVGNHTRVKVPSGVIAAHIRGPLAELELWTDWRDELEQNGRAPHDHDDDFDAFMASESSFAELSWRAALAEHEHARGRAVAAMTDELARLLDA